uniref:Uncharacterized protein n=1 Tax=Strigamia maritima TaxID=126957 RepID=T1IY37_STRMM
MMILLDWIKELHSSRVPFDKMTAQEAACFADIAQRPPQNAESFFTHSKPTGNLAILVESKNKNKSYDVMTSVRRSPLVIRNSTLGHPTLTVGALADARCLILGLVVRRCVVLEGPYLHLVDRGRRPVSRRIFEARDLINRTPDPPTHS